MSVMLSFMISRSLEISFTSILIKISSLITVDRASISDSVVDKAVLVYNLEHHEIGEPQIGITYLVLDFADIGSLWSSYL